MVLHCWCTVHVTLQPCNKFYQYRTGYFIMARVAFVIAFLHYGCSAASQSSCARGLQLIQHKTKHAKTMDNTGFGMASKGIRVQEPWAGFDCLPATDWLGTASSAEECAELCYSSTPTECCHHTPGGTARIVWVEYGDRNCKCAASNCTVSAWEYGAVYTFNIPTTTTTTAWPGAVDLLWDRHTCSPAEPWMGRTETVERCAERCIKGGYPRVYRIVWEKNGGKNCRCAYTSCTPSEWEWGAVYNVYRTTTTSTTNTITTTTAGGPTFQEGGAGCCRDSAGLSPAYSHERLFKRPISEVWGTESEELYNYNIPPWSSLEELEESIQSNCLKEPTCSGYQKLSCTTWGQDGSFGSDCNVRYYCNSDFPNWLCNNLGDSGSANVVMGMPGMPECANTCMVQAPAPLSTTWTTTWAAVMTDAGAGTACVGGPEDPEAYLTQMVTPFDLSYDQVVQLCLDDPNCHAIALRTECEPIDYGSLLQESSASVGCCGCLGDWTVELRLYQMRYAYPGDGVTLSGNGVAPTKSEDGRTKDHAWQDYFRCYVKVQGTAPTTSMVSTATTAPTSSATTMTTTTASSFIRAPQQKSGWDKRALLRNVRSFAMNRPRNTR